MTDADLVRWVVDRLVNVHGESPNLDYCHRLRRLADWLDAEAAQEPLPSFGQQVAAKGGQLSDEQKHAIERGGGL